MAPFISFLAEFLWPKAIRGMNAGPVTEEKAS
jgi:hypothetical protein